MANIFVTGVSGAAGQAIARELIEQGNDVVGLCHKSFPALPLRTVFGNLSEPGPWLHEVARADAIVHCASPRTSDRQLVMHQEMESLAQILTAWRKAPFVLMSSQTVYGIPSGPMHEDQPTFAHSWYDIGKVTGELQLEMAEMDPEHSPRRGISLRLPLLFGTGPAYRNNQYLPKLFDAVRARQPFVFETEAALTTAGSVFIGDRDLGHAVLAVLTTPARGRYNVASGFSTWHAILLGLAKRIGVELDIRVGRPCDHEGAIRLSHAVSAYDCSRFAADTGFSPRQTLDEILDAFAAAERI